MSNLEEFKEFVKSHQDLKFEVRSGKKTWQQIYEEWSLLGDKNDEWDKYKTKNERISKEGLGAILDYVKKINPDNVSKTLNNVSKIVSLIQGFGAGGKSSGIATGDPLFDKKFDDWY